MIKMFCDRCGAEIKERKYGWLLHREHYSRQRLIPYESYDDWEDADKYLCPECEKQYIHWFMNPEPQKEEGTK